MHYEHYTTLMQALNLLYDEWKTLSNNDTNYDKCDLVSNQIVGLLQRGLPAIDRFAFARAFKDEERTTTFEEGQGSFPDSSGGDSVVPGLVVDEAIYGGLHWLDWLWGGAVWPGVMHVLMDI